MVDLALLYRIDCIVDELQDLQETVSSEDRVRIWNELQNGFCPRCGQDERKSGKCYCDPSYDRES